MEKFNHDFFSLPRMVAHLFFIYILPRFPLSFSSFFCLRLCRYIFIVCYLFSAYSACFAQFFFRLHFRLQFWHLQRTRSANNKAARAAARRQQRAKASQRERSEWMTMNERERESDSCCGRVLRASVCLLIAIAGRHAFASVCKQSESFGFDKFSLQLAVLSSIDQCSTVAPEFKCGAGKKMI